MTDTKLSRTIASTATIKIASIGSLDLFYTPLEERFERITRLARRALQMPVAGITLLNDDTQWFKSVAGWSVAQISRADSLCQHTAATRATLLISDTRDDERTARSPLVEGGPCFHAYAGHPLFDGEGNVVGTFCAFDVKPRKFSANDRQTILDLGALAQRELLADTLSNALIALTAKLSNARREAMIDPLTRLWNRRGASVLLKSAIETADQNQTPLGVAVLDLDNFKRINDTYGHQTGDEVLRRVSSRLVGTVREEDIACRLGGDEFLVVMLDTDSVLAAKVADRLRRTIAATAIPTRDGPLPASASVGYTVRLPGDTSTVEALIERADGALLESKAAGRNRVRATA